MRYGLSSGALRRHRARHLSKELAKAFVLRAQDKFPRQDRAIEPEARPEDVTEIVADHLIRASNRAGGNGDGIDAAAMEMVVRAETRVVAQIEMGASLLQEVESLRARTLAILDAAEADNQRRTALKAIAQAADLLKLQGAFLIEAQRQKDEAPPTATEADEAWEMAGARIYGTVAVVESG